MKTQKEPFRPNPGFVDRVRAAGADKNMFIGNRFENKNSKDGNAGKSCRCCGRHTFLQKYECPVHKAMVNVKQKVIMLMYVLNTIRKQTVHKVNSVQPKGDSFVRSIGIHKKCEVKSEYS